MIAKHKYVGAVLLGLAVFALGGCSKEAKKARHLERAQAHFTAGDYERAEIEFVNALRLDSTNHVVIRDLGIISYKQGRLPRAYMLLKRAKDSNTNDLEVRLNLGLSELALGGAKEAHEEAGFVLHREPTNGSAMLLLVDSIVTTNDLTNAQQRLEQIKAVAGEVTEFHLAQGGLALHNRNLDSAAASFRQALSLGPKSVLAHAAMGQLHALRNDPTNAAAEFKVAAELSPPRSAHRIRYADLKAAAGDTNAALQMLEEITKQAPDYLPALLKQADYALAARQFEKAEGLIKSILQRDGTNLSALQQMAQLRMALGDPVKAIFELDRAIKQYPRLPQLHYRKAIIQLANNDSPAAVNSLNQALTLQPDFPEVALLLAQINIRKGELDPVVTSLKALLQKRPGLVPAQFLLATAYEARGDLDEALKIYLSVSKAFTNDARSPFQAGLVQRQQNKKDEARKSFEKALALAPDTVSALEQLVRLDLEVKHFDAARSRVKQAVERHPKSPQPLCLLAQVYLAETNHAQAEAALLKAVELAPDDPTAHQMLARIYVASNRYQDALNKLQDVVSRNTNDIASWLRIAQMQSTASNYSEAGATYERILTLNPSFLPALNNLACLHAEQLGDLARAYDLASKARTAHPDDPFTADTLGWICYLRGEFARALSLIQQSADRFPEESEVLFHLGMTHYMLGEEAAAKVALQKALQLGRDATWREAAQARLQALAVDPATADAQSVASLEKSLAERPSEPPLQLRMAAVRERQGEWNKAAAAYEAALKTNPNLVSALVRLAQINSSKLNKRQEAMELARKARDLSPGDPAIAHTLGALAFQAANHEWAFSLLSESARKLPNDLNVRYDLAWAAYSLGQASNAVLAMRQVMEAGPNASHYQDAKTFIEMSLPLSNPGEAEKSAAQAPELLKKQKDYVPALMVNGILLEQKGDFASARDAYNLVLERMPLFSPANKQLAVLCFDKLREPEKAYDNAVKARKAFPADLEIARVLGILEYKRGQFARAIQFLTEISSKSQATEDVLYYLGMAQFKLKRSSESKATLTRALEAAPGSSLAPEAKKILAELK